MKAFVGLRRRGEFHHVGLWVNRRDRLVIGRAREIRRAPDSCQVGVTTLFLQLAQEKAAVRVLEVVFLVGWMAGDDLFVDSVVALLVDLTGGPTLAQLGVGELIHVKVAAIPRRR